MEPIDGEILRKDRMARSRGYCSFGQRRCVILSSFPLKIKKFLIHDPIPDQIFLILYRELYYRHVYSRLQPDIDDRFHSYENSCELFNYLLSRTHFLSLITVVYILHRF